MEGVKAFISGYLDPIGIVVGLVIAFPIFWTWYEVAFGHKRRLRRWHHEIRQTAGNRPGMLIVDLLPEKSIRNSVEHFRSQQASLRDIPSDRIVEVIRNQRISPDDMPQLAKDIRANVAHLIASGADVIHFFYAGPTVVSAIVGAELANTARVLVYQHDPDGYHNFGPLRVDV